MSEKRLVILRGGSLDGRVVEADLYPHTYRHPVTVDGAESFEVYWSEGGTTERTEQGVLPVMRLLKVVSVAQYLDVLVDGATPMTLELDGGLDSPGWTARPQTPVGAVSGRLNSTVWVEIRSGEHAGQTARAHLEELGVDDYWFIGDEGFATR